MKRRLRGLGAALVWVVVGGSVALPAEPLPSCDGQPPWPDLGLETLHCPGGICGLQVGLGSAAGRPEYRFATEPRLSGIDPDGPAAGILEEGDVLVAVNGLLITSRRGGEALASLPIGEPAALSVRRGVRLLALEVRPTGRCAPPRTISSSRFADAVLPFPLPRRGRVGLSIECERCRFDFGDPDQPWSGPARLRLVVRVEPDSLAWEAGLRAGDVLTHVDGVSLQRKDANESLFRSLMVPLPVERWLHVTYRRGPAVGEARVRIPAQSGEPHAAEPRERWSKLDRIWSRIFRDRDRDEPPRLEVVDLAVDARSWGTTHLGLTFKNYPGFNLAAVLNPNRGQRAWSAPQYLEVLEVASAGPGDLAGIRPGDILLAVDGLDLRTPEGGRRLLADRSGEHLRLRVRRDSGERILTLITGD